MSEINWLEIFEKQYGFELSKLNTDTGKAKFLYDFSNYLQFQLADREKAIVSRLNDIILMPETNFMEWGPKAELKIDKLKSDIESGSLLLDNELSGNPRQLIDNKKESGDGN